MLYSTGRLTCCIVQADCPRLFALRSECQPGGRVRVRVLILTFDLSSAPVELGVEY